MRSSITQKSMFVAMSTRTGLRILGRLKRAIRWTYVNVEPYHLFRDRDEQAYKFNNRLMNHAEQFIVLAQSVIGRCVTYAELTDASTTTA